MSGTGDPARPNGPEMRRARKRLAEYSWFVFLWLASLVVVSAVAYAIRSVLL